MVRINEERGNHSISENYGLILYESFAEAIGIDIITQKRLASLDSDDIIKFQLDSYINYHIRVMDENEGRKARITFPEDVLENETSLRRALSIDLSDEDIERMLRNIKLIYSMNALTSTKVNNLDAWNLILDKKGNRVLGVHIKRNSKSNLCNLGYPQEIVEMASEILNGNSELLPEYIDMIKSVDQQEPSMYQEAANFSEIYNKNPEGFRDYALAVTSINPQTIISSIENQQKIKIPKPYTFWFCATVDRNKDYLESRIQNKFQKN